MDVPRKIRRPSAAGMAMKTRAISNTDALNVGDAVDYGLTIEVKHPRKGSYWPKMGASTTVRPGETAEQALSRLQVFVVEQIDAQVHDILDQ